MRHADGHCSPIFTFEGVTAHGGLLEVSFGFKGECNIRDVAWTRAERRVEETLGDPRAPDRDPRDW